MDLYTTPPAHLFPGNTGIWFNVGVDAVSGFDLRSRNIESLDQIKAARSTTMRNSAASPGNIAKRNFARRAA